MLFIGGNPLCLASKVHAAPRQDEVAQVDDFIRYHARTQRDATRRDATRRNATQRRYTLYGIKDHATSGAKPPYKSLQAITI